MKILITENQYKLISELQGQFKDETEIIYRDKNIVCLIPKSQMTSKIFGKGTKWCQTEGGFNIWARQGLLIRFLLKGGRKIRFTYFFNKDGMYAENHDFYWANETGYHVLWGDGNPFEVTSPKNKIRDIEKDILEQIRRIPEECKNKVLEFIENHKNCYDYKYRDEMFYTKKEQLSKKLNGELIQLMDELFDRAYDLRRKNGFIMNFYYKDGKYILQYGYGYLDHNEIFTKFKSIKLRILTILNIAKKGGEFNS